MVAVLFHYLAPHKEVTKAGKSLVRSPSTTRPARPRPHHHHHHRRRHSAPRPRPLVPCIVDVRGVEEHDVTALQPWMSGVLRVCAGAVGL